MQLLQYALQNCVRYYDRDIVEVCVCVCVCACVWRFAILELCGVSVSLSVSRQMTRILPLVLNPSNLFYLTTGVPAYAPLPIMETDDADDDSMYVDLTWVDTAKVGDKVDFWSKEVEKWVVAEIVDISPTLTEMHLRPAGGKADWFSLEHGAVAPLGEGPTRKETIVAAKAAASAAATAPDAPPVDDSWRGDLRPGVLCDAYSSTKSWYQVVVLAEAVDNGVDRLRVRFQDNTSCRVCVLRSFCRFRCVWW